MSEIKPQTQFDLLYQQSREQNNAQILVSALPYAQQLGMVVERVEGDWQFKLPPVKTNIGNPSLPAIHGGAIAGFMSMSAIIYLLMSYDQKCTTQPPKVPKVVDFSVDYVRACRYVDTFATCEVVRQGRKMANVGVRVWQQNSSNVTATARAHYLLS
ncbi:PaaI family thioesterase [Aurantivibrio plasticivorans]